MVRSREFDCATDSTCGKERRTCFHVRNVNSAKQERCEFTGVFPCFKARSSSYKYRKYNFFEDKIKFHEVDLPMTMDCAAMKKDFLIYFEDLHLEITKRKSFFLLF